MKQTKDEYFAELEKKQENAKHYEFAYGGGYEASKGDFEGACLARAEFEAGSFD